MPGAGMPELSGRQRGVQCFRFDARAYRPQDGRLDLRFVVGRDLAAMKDGGDGAVMTFKVANGSVDGTITLETGVLRWVGKMMSAFSSENFE